MSEVEKLGDDIRQFLKLPIPVWETVLTDLLVERKYKALTETCGGSRQGYTTISAFSGKPADPTAKKWLIGVENSSVYIEHPSEMLKSFYDDHGLKPLSTKRLLQEKAPSKLTNAFEVLGLVPYCASGATALVNCIQVIESDQPDYDTSYSHPDIPFTIFVSVCETQSMIANMRVAENILHEAMHLKLTLIEEILPMVQPSCKDTFYSPWREEHRPLRGVLHGLFVFRAIIDFYRAAMPSLAVPENSDFAAWRIESIDAELRQIKDFGSSALTKDGAILTASLLPSN